MEYTFHLHIHMNSLESLLANYKMVSPSKIVTVPDGIRTSCVLMNVVETGNILQSISARPKVPPLVTFNCKGENVEAGSVVCTDSEVTAKPMKPLELAGVKVTYEVEERPTLGDSVTLSNGVTTEGIEHELDV